MRSKIATMLVAVVVVVGVIAVTNGWFSGADGADVQIAQARPPALPPRGGAPAAGPAAGAPPAPQWVALTVTPPQPPAAVIADGEVALPGPADEAVLGGGTRFLLVASHRAQQITVLDLQTRQITQRLAVPSDVFGIAAGMKSFVVVLPEQEQIQKYDLASGKLEASTPYVWDPKVQRRLPGSPKSKPPRPAVAMGASSHGPIVICSPGFTMTGGSMSVHDLQTLKPVPITWPQQDEQLLRENPHRVAWIWQRDHAATYPNQLRASADGLTVVGWRDNLSPSSLWMMHMAVGSAGVRVIDCRTLHTDPGYAVPNDDGSLIATGMGILSANLTARIGDRFDRGFQDWRYNVIDRMTVLTKGQIPPRIIVLPVPNAPLFVGITPPSVQPQERPGLPIPHVNLKVALYSDKTDKPIADLPDIPEFPSRPGVYVVSDRTRAADTRDYLSFDRRIFCLPDQGILVTIPPSGGDAQLAPRVVWHGLPAAALVAEGAGLRVMSLPGLAQKGKQWSYAMRVAGGGEGLEASLASAPSGMKINADGSITWAVPANYASDRVGVIVILRNRQGQSLMHSFSLTVNR